MRRVNFLLCRLRCPLVRKCFIVCVLWSDLFLHHWLINDSRKRRKRPIPFLIERIDCSERRTWRGMHKSKCMCADSWSCCACVQWNRGVSWAFWAQKRHCALCNERRLRQLKMTTTTRSQGKKRTDFAPHYAGLTNSGTLHIQLSWVSLFFSRIFKAREICVWA